MAGIDELRQEGGKKSNPFGMVAETMKPWMKAQENAIGGPALVAVTSGARHCCTPR